ncbi:MAG: hypothetical protein AAGJ91_12675 [Pseudomonadota bacterium]
MFRMMLSEDGRACIGLQTGAFCAKQTLIEVDRAYRMGDVRPGLDGITIFDDTFDANGVSVAALTEISARIAEHEGDETFRSIMVAPTRHARMISEVLVGTWRAATPRTPPSHTIVTDLRTAERMLNVTGVATQTHHLRPAPGVSYLSEYQSRKVA